MGKSQKLGLACCVLSLSDTVNMESLRWCNFARAGGGDVTASEQVTGGASG